MEVAPRQGGEIVMRKVGRALVVGAVALPLAVQASSAAAVERTTAHDLLRTAGTVATTCTATGHVGDTCQEFWFAAAVGSERHDGVARQVNRTEIILSTLTWSMDGYDGTPDWVYTDDSASGEATGGAAITADLQSATMTVHDVPLYPSGDTSVDPVTSVSAAIQVAAPAGRPQVIRTMEKDRGNYTGSLVLGHFERWRDATATATVNFAPVPTVAYLTYIGVYQGHWDARSAAQATGRVTPSFLKAHRPGTLRSNTQYGYAKGEFGMVEVGRVVDLTSPNTTQLYAVVDGNWVDMTGNPSFRFTQNGDMSGGTATFVMDTGTSTTTWSITWTATAAMQTERSFTRDVVSHDQARWYVESRQQSAVVTVNGQTCTGSGDLSSTATAWTQSW
jgi:hypothetical protein